MQRFITSLRARWFGDAPASADFGAMIVFAALFSSAVWFHLDHVNVLLLVTAVAAFALAPHLPVPPASEAEPPPPLTRAGLVRSLPIAALIVLPTLVQLIAHCNEEFPWAGDAYFHLFASPGVRSFWAHHGAGAFAFIWIPYLLRRARVRYWAPISFAALLAWSFTAVAPLAAARYPASGYLIEAPLRMILNPSTYGDPALLLDRISMAASVFVWLFVLRPLVLRRWPDLNVLPFAIFYFWQRDVSYYLTSVYLEAWEIVLVLVAVELVLSDRPSRTWLPPLLVGAAATFKEPAFLILPWICLACVTFLPRTLRAWAGAAVNAYLAALPFLVYLRFRTDSSVARTFTMLPWGELWSPSRLHKIGHRALAEFGVGGLILLALSLGVLIATAWRYRDRRWVLLCMLGAVVSQFLFFYADAASVFYTGYSRFYLLGLGVLGMAAWTAAPALRAHPRFGSMVIAAAIGIALLHAPSLGSYLALLRQPDPARNYMEDPDGPVYYPIHALVDEAEQAGAIAPGAVITVQTPTMGVDLVGIVYPTLGAKYSFPVVTTDCRCAPDRTTLLLPIAYPTNLRSEPGGIPLTDATTACIRAMRDTYQRIFERSIDDYPTGLLGAGCKYPAAAPVVR